MLFRSRNFIKLTGPLAYRHEVTVTLMRRKASAPRNNAARQAVRCIVIATVCLFVSGSALLQPARSVCVASERFIIIIIIISVVVIQRLLLKCH